MKVDVYYTKSDHLTRIMTGLHLLEKQGVLECRYIEDKNHDVLPDSANMLELRINDKRIAFDLRDASALNQERNWSYLTSVDAYFERSHTNWKNHAGIADQAEKIYPFGFNYYMTYPGNPAFVPSSSKNYLKNILRNAINCSKYTRVEAFEGKADYDPPKKPRIIFMTRLWSPDEVKIPADASAEKKAYREKMIEERRKINADRIEICRQLRNIYGSQFCGGIQSSSYAVKLCPDVILPSRMTMKQNYLKLMKGSDICIGSSGLEKSIGWKTGEYVAAARAIVCEELAYLLPGDFAAGKNYLSYHDVSSCLNAVDALCSDPQSIYDMQLANEQYYREYLRPEKQILNALAQCGIRL